MPSVARRIAVVAAGALIVSLAVIAVDVRAARGFSEASLRGTFAAVGEGDGHVSSSVGTVFYDGHGNVSRALQVNAPDGMGGRRLLLFESVGVYEVNEEGTGIIMLENTIDGEATTETTFDFVIQETKGGGKGGARRATKLFGVQREAGTTVDLVTTKESLISG